MSTDKVLNDLPARLAMPARRALAGIGIHSLEQLSHCNEVEIRQLHGIGPNAMIHLRRALAEKGLSFKAEAQQ